MKIDTDDIQLDSTLVIIILLLVALGGLFVMSSVDTDSMGPTTEAPENVETPSEEAANETNSEPEELPSLVQTHVSAFRDSSGTIQYTTEVDGQVVYQERRVFNDMSREFGSQAIQGQTQQLVYQNDTEAYIGEITAQSNLTVSTQEVPYSLERSLFASQLGYYVTNIEYTQVNETTYEFDSLAEDGELANSQGVENVTDIDSRITVNDNQQITEFTFEYTQETPETTNTTITIEYADIGSTTVPEPSWITGPSSPSESDSETNSTRP